MRRFYLLVLILEYFVQKTTFDVGEDVKNIYRVIRFTEAIETTIVCYICVYIFLKYLLRIPSRLYLLHNYMIFNQLRVLMGLD